MAFLLRGPLTRSPASSTLYVTGVYPRGAQLPAGHPSPSAAPSLNSRRSAPHRDAAFANGTATISRPPTPPATPRSRSTTARRRASTRTRRRRPRRSAAASPSVLPASLLGVEPVSVRAGERSAHVRGLWPHRHVRAARGWQRRRRRPACAADGGARQLGRVCRAGAASASYHTPLRASPRSTAPTPPAAAGASIDVGIGRRAAPPQCARPIVVLPDAGRGAPSVAAPPRAARRCSRVGRGAGRRGGGGGAGGGARLADAGVERASLLKPSRLAALARHAQRAAWSLDAAGGYVLVGVGQGALLGRALAQRGCGGGGGAPAPTVLASLLGLQGGADRPPVEAAAGGMLPPPPAPPAPPPPPSPPPPPAPPPNARWTPRPAPPPGRGGGGERGRRRRPAASSCASLGRGRITEGRGTAAPPPLPPSTIWPAPSASPARRRRT